ncbi:MAG: hypothetical protein IPF53_11880 [Blastocatellia bacterium]|nr:hypothetical protein [Blastocatellia bacterium]
MTPELEEIGRFVSLLSRLSIRHVIVGSYASSAHGVARATQDIDLVAEIPVESVDALFSALKDTHYIDPDSIRRAIQTGRSFNIIHLATMLKFDVYVPRGNEAARRHIDRGQWSTIGGALDEPVLVASPEDVVVSKLRWFRRGGEVSVKQWEDVLGVLRVQHGRLDVEYMERTAGEERVRDLLDRAVAQIYEEER